MKANRLIPNVIYLKDNRDKLLLMTEKHEKIIPECQHGYYGGSPPRREGKYTNHSLSMKFREQEIKRILAEKRRIERKAAGLGTGSILSKTNPDDDRLSDEESWEKLKRLESTNLAEHVKQRQRAGAS